MRYILVVILLCVLQACCSSRVTDYATKSDTCFITQRKVDSVYLHDSISLNVYRDRDTIFKVITNHRNHYYYRTIVDTIYKSKVDTIRINYAHNRHISSDDRKGSSFTSTLFLIILFIIIISIVLTKWIGTK